MKRSIKNFVAILVAMAFLPVSAALAAENANPVKERQKLMRSVGKAMKTTVKMLRGELAYDAAIVSDKMKIMSDVAGKYTGLFPDGSDMDNSIMDFDQDSDAKPQIWANMDDFKARATALKTAADAAMKVVGDKAAMGAALGNVGSACKGCHEKYKADKKE